MIARDFRCVFLDTETTGLDPAVDRIVSYSLRAWSLQDGPGPAVSALVLPVGVHVSPEVRAINGFDEATWIARGATHFQESHAWQIAYHLTDGCILAGSNPQFDRRFLEAEFARIGWAFPKVSPRMIDTNSLAAPLLVIGHIRGTGLSSLCDYFSIPTPNRHTAHGDVDASIEVFEALLAAYLLAP